MRRTITLIALVIGAMLLSSCGSETPDIQNTSVVQMGDTVAVDYTGRLENGTVFDSSEGREPLEFQVGAGQVITGFENGVLGMEVNETKTITIAPEQAYGQYNESLIVEQNVPLANFSKETMTDYLDEYITVTTDKLQPLLALADVGAENVTLEIDQNHPLAGETLIFDVTVTDIERAPQNVPGPTQ